MRKESSASDKSISGFRFAFPVILENIFTVVIGLVFSAILGKISVSSLAAAGTGNQVISCVTAFFAIVSTGASILTALNTGKGDRRRTSEIVEHAVFLSPIVSVVMTVLLLIVSSPLMRLLMPGADEAFLEEGVVYFRVVALSLPGLMMDNTFLSILRSAGESRVPLICTVIMNVVQILAASLFVGVMNMGLAGAGLAYVVCRYAGMLALGYAIFRHTRAFEITLNGILKPNLSCIGRIFSMGAPNVIDGIAVQGGYIFINSLLIGLGKNDSSIYNVLQTLISFSGICQPIVSVSVTTLTGHKIGAGDIKGARKNFRNILCIGLLATLALSAILLLFPSFFTGLFTDDAFIHAESARLVWLTLLFAIPAVAVNASEPGVRVGGMSKHVAVSCTLCVWLIRVPLTWFFCYKMNLGVSGVFFANTIACYARAIIAVWIIHTKRWSVKM
ncbi:MAG: MATE family efflux transporter [Clostridia bacterium]|nr:MATE family efflux transporter [Clostridia bacterium]